MNKVRSGASRFTRIVLVVSLALNLAVAGLIVGVVASGRLGDGPPRVFDFGLGPVARALDRRELRQIGIGLRRDGALRELNLRGRMAATMDALRAEPFDREAVRVLMASQSEAIAQFQETAQGLLLDQIAAMTPERRAEFADRLQEEMRRARPRRSEGSGG